jgi:hypothetical protein
MSKENGKDVANSLSEYSNTINKGTNIALDSVNQINKWYEKQVEKIIDGNIQDTRLETNVDNNIVEETEEKINKLQTKLENYTEIQTNNKKNNVTNQNVSKLKTQKEDEKLEDAIKNENEVKELENKKGKINSKISTAIKGMKFINNTANKFIKTGKTLNTATNEGGLKSFEKSSSRIMTKPAKKVAEKVTSKLGKETKKVVKKQGKKFVKKTVSVVEKTTKIIAKLVAESMKVLVSMLPSIAPIIIIILIIAAIGNFFNFKTSDEADNINFDEISSYMIQIDDPNLQAIYNEFLKNMGKPYLMDHSNLSYDTCMETYDCSSFVIHCLAHTGIKTIPNTGASGLYSDYCNPVEVNNRQAGDLIFLKDTYDTGTPGGISHVGIYMGTLTIKGETAEWVIDTGGNPEGVKISKYNNGWWNGSNFYGFGRLK